MICESEFQIPDCDCESDFRAAVTVVVATEDFCTGTDAPDVRTVLFAGGARSLRGILARSGARRTGWKGGWRSRLANLIDLHFPVYHQLILTSSASPSGATVMSYETEV